MKAPSPKAGLVALSSIAVLTAVWAGLYFYWVKEYQGRILPGVKIGDLDLGGTSREQATNLLQARADRIVMDGLTFAFQNNKKTLPTNEVSFDSAASFPILAFDVDKMIGEAFGPDKNQGFFDFVHNLFKSSSQKTLAATYDADRTRINAWLDESFPDLHSPAEDAYFSWDPSGDGSLIKNPERNGQEIDKDAAWRDLTASLDVLESPVIVLNPIIIPAQVRIGQLDGQESVVREALANNKLTLTAPEGIALPTGAKSKWSITKDRLITWIKVKDDKPLLDEAKIAAHLSETVAPVIDSEAVLPRFEMRGTKVTSWQPGKPGYKLDTTASAAAIAEDFSVGKSETRLIAEKISAADMTAGNDFQIKEIIGTGHSRFSGSPSNRRHNIKTGAEALHGLLVPPGEEFSLLHALGDIDASTGYLPELVIKGSKTVPEYGGGLCQIGTTVFRAALSSGLPITERRNHSYRVSYYEPAGTDATIYDPAPDFKFMNDTGNYVLIQARIEGDDLYFDFWGVSDGRIATTTDPIIYNIVKPAPTKIIETEDLKPGEKKCTESAHSGADAYFDYTVTYPAGSTTTPVQTRRFSSHYIPWQAVCLVGKEITTTSTPENKGIATTTPTESPGAATSSPTD